MTRATILSLLAMTAAACGDEAKTITPDAPVQMMEPEVITVPEEITANTTWTSDKPYLIPRLTHVFVRKGATLTIQPGTEIRGEKGAVLVISRGAKIIAEGTVDKPIVMTSAQPVGQRTPGYWGGLLVLGYAPVNVNVKSKPPSNEALFEAFSNADGDSGRFGGDQPADNSGVLKYVRIEFGGFNFVADREFNNLTLCGVGSATTVDFVQVHGGADDGIELFGGTVNVKHIVSSQNEDDGFDTDNGWQGKAQFVIVQNIAHRPGVVLEASNGYESDNHGTAESYEAEPRTLPTVSNVTLIGDHSFAEQPSFAAVFRRGTGGHYVNHLWLNFPRGPEFRDPQTETQLTAGNLTVAYSMFFGNDGAATNLPVPQATGDIVEANYLTTDGATAAGRADPHNTFNLNPGLPAAATSRTAPAFQPMANAPALTAGTTPPADPFFDASATFAGAIGTVDWTAGWTKYPQN
jgi:hypothetical protein